MEERKELLTSALSKETGKPPWEAKGELAAVLGKLAISIDALHLRTPTREISAANPRLMLRHKAHGVVGILGPYNFPLHLPNGHILPALLAGNTVIFKPSELTPLSAELYVQCWNDAGLPPGVLNLLQGGAAVGKALVQQKELRGLFFTGSWETGRKIAEASTAFPKRILALEMGGNNPLVVWKAADIDKAVSLTILSAFITAGQRCSCARRLIVRQSAEGNAFVDELVRRTRLLVVASPESTPEPFMGPLIHYDAAIKLWDGYERLVARGALALLPMERPFSAFVRPSILDCTTVQAPDDCELFGPLLQIYRADTFEEAIVLANNTEYGLCAGLISDDRALYDQFWQNAEAGIVNWNSPLTGASSQAPFGGIGKSGNFHPSAFYAADYCAYPVASMESSSPFIASYPPGMAHERGLTTNG